MAAVAGQPFDRRPFSGVFSLYGSRLIDCPVQKYYTDSQSFIEGQTKVMELIGPDLITTPLTLVAEGEAFGSQIKFLSRRPPNLKSPAAPSLDDIAKLRMPDISTHPRLVYTRECLRGLKKRFGDEVLIAALLLNPTDIPIMITTMEVWLPAVVRCDAEVEILLEKTSRFFLQWADMLIEEGADLLVMPSPFTIPTVVTRELAASYAKPVLQNVFSQIKVPLFLHHVGAPYAKFIDIFADLPNLAGFVVDHSDSLEQARENAGPDKLLLGGLDGPNLDRLSREEVERKTLSILEERRDDPHFMFMLTGPDVNYNTPLENILAVKQTVENFGSRG